MVLNIIFLQLMKRNESHLKWDLIKLSKIMASVTFGIKLEKSYQPMDYKNMILEISN